MATASISGRVLSRYVLDPRQILHFHEQGYLTLSHVLSEAECAALEMDYMDFISGEVPEMGRDFCDMSGPYGRAYEDFNLINAMLPRVYRSSLRGNVFERVAQSIAEQLIGQTATLDYDQFLAKKPAKQEAAFAMHQDMGYWPTNTPDTKTTTCSLALDDADEINGCLRVVPGSHLEPELRAHVPVVKADKGEGLRDGGHTLGIEMRPEDRVLLQPVRRGDITVHNERIIHGSSGNRSQRWRRTYVIAHRSRACVDYERSIGFTHSHNDKINWTTHLMTLAE